MIVRKGLRRSGPPIVRLTLPTPSRSLRPLGDVAASASHFQSSSGFASSSKSGPLILSSHRYSAATYQRKGKQRADTSLSDMVHLSQNIRRPALFSWSPLHLESQTVATYPYTHSHRGFHSTSRVDAIPMIPVAAAVIKSGSALTVLTAVTRVLVSFLPLGTIATFKFARGVRWLEGDAQVPKSSEASEEFWQMWCKGEKGIRFKGGEAEQFVDGQVDEYGGLVAKDGRAAYHMPIAPGGRGTSKDKYSIKNMRDRGEEEERILKLIQSRWFILPSLPPASIRYYDELSAEERREVDALRRYWISLRMFKDTLKYVRWFVSALLGIPFLLFIGVIGCGMEQVPLTGRRRLILLTPEEEDAISTSLAGANWYRSVINLLTTAENPAPPIVPYDDWRWKWVQGVLLQLESAVLKECHNHESGYRPPNDSPTKLLPPPASYPLKPRPRVSSLLHGALPGSDKLSGREHLELGPPYSLMILEKDERNAFSYGFGGKGAGGVVVFTGLLDDILKSPMDLGEDEAEPPSRNEGFFGSIFSTPRPRPKRRTPQPTEEQTLHLACVLAHEMGHLLLSHHLETLSQQQVFWPAMLGLSVDLLRAFIWPFTFLLGPTVNDALANVGKTSAEVVAGKYGEIGFQWKHEYEADLAGLRLLALAGFDPDEAVNHFGGSVADLHEINPSSSSSSSASSPLSADHRENSSWSSQLLKLWSTTTHPSSEKRVQALQEELERWRSVWQSIEDGNSG